MFIKRGMEKEAVVHIYNGILLSYKRKEIGLFVETWMDLETRESYRVKYMTERLHFYFSLSCTGEENGNPLQCSCLENPRDGGAWWAAIYGVAQSQT